MSHSVKEMISQELILRTMNSGVLMMMVDMEAKMDVFLVKRFLTLEESKKVSAITVKNMKLLRPELTAHVLRQIMNAI
jgi:hypothetical protein